MLIPFDQKDSKAKYEFVIDSAEAETGDGIILNANREALLAFAELFRDLASHDGEVHIHLGYTEEDPQGPGFRIVANNSGRSV